MVFRKVLCTAWSFERMMASMTKREESNDGQRALIHTRIAVVVSIFPFCLCWDIACWNIFTPFTMLNTNVIGRHKWMWIIISTTLASFNIARNKYYFEWYHQICARRVLIWWTSDFFCWLWIRRCIWNSITEHFAMDVVLSKMKVMVKMME